MYSQKNVEKKNNYNLDLELNTNPNQELILQKRGSIAICNKNWSDFNT